MSCWGLHKDGGISDKRGAGRHSGVHFLSRKCHGLFSLILSGVHTSVREFGTMVKQENPSNDPT